MSEPGDDKPPPPPDAPPEPAAQVLYARGPYGSVSSSTNRPDGTPTTDILRVFAAALLTIAIGIALLVLLGVLVFGLIFLLFGGVLAIFAADLGSATPTPGVVKAHSWTREIKIESRQWVRDEDWCSDIPSSANVLDREEKYKERDRRIGRDRDIYAEWCTYETLQWRYDHTETSEGNGTATAPYWPVFTVDTCSDEGCTRELSRKETYTLELEVGPTNEAASCAVDQNAWNAKTDGQVITVNMGGLTGMPVCTTLK